MTMATDEQVDEFIALIDETRPVQLFHHIDEATVGAGGIMRMLCCAKVGDDPVTAGAIAEELHVSTARSRRFSRTWRPRVLSRASARRPMLASRWLP